MKVRQPAQEFVLLQIDAPEKQGAILLPNSPPKTTGMLLSVGHKAAEEGWEAGQRVLFVKEAIRIVTRKGGDEQGDTVVMHVENLRAVIE